MGSCYSHKAGGGKYTYSTVQMASTKLDDTSRLARPTPYCRGSGTLNFTNRKGIPISTRPDLPSPHNEQKNSRIPSPSPLQSSIPRFNSNITTANTKEVNENINLLGEKMDNTGLNALNNNSPISTMIGKNSRKDLSPKPESRKKMTHPTAEKKSKVWPEQTTSQVTRLTARFSSPVVASRSLLPHFSPRTNMRGNVESQAEMKSNCLKSNRSNNGSKSNLSSSSNVTTESHTSIADFDSGIGSSLTETARPEDSDTLQGIEKLESYEAESASECDRKPVIEAKQSLKCPAYKRALNGKWTIENCSSGASKMSPGNANNGKLSQDKSSQFRKGNAYNSPIATYASYKGLMSAKKTTTKGETATMSMPKIDVVAKSPTSNGHQPVSSLLLHSQCKESTKSPSEDKESDSAILPTSPASSIQTSSFESDKSDGLGSDTKSPPSEIENREFLIDDEIADQPSLISFVNGKMVESPPLSLQQSVTELHALQSMSCSMTKSMGPRERLGSDHRDSLFLSSELGSSCSSIASDDLMLDYEKKSDFTDGPVNEALASPMRKMKDLEQIEDQISELQKLQVCDSDEKLRKRLHRRSSGSIIGSGGLGKDEWRLRSVSLPLRPPRPMSVSEADDGSVVLDSSSYRLLSQDLNGLKTMLLRLKGVIQEAETINPFDNVNTKHLFYHNLVNSETPLILGTDSNKTGGASMTLENADLRRQVILLQQQMEEKNRTILLLQQQMTKYTNGCYMPYENPNFVNSATQTDRTRSLTGSLTSSLENSSETLVSFQDFTEDALEFPKVPE